MAEKEVNLPQLFSDVSRTISGISNIMGAGEGDSDDKSSKPAGNVFGNTCFKACGMEDIQFAARSAGEMFSTIRVCVLASTVICLVIFITFSLLVGCYFFCSNTQKVTSAKSALPECIRKMVSSTTCHADK